MNNYLMIQIIMKYKSPDEIQYKPKFKNKMILKMINLLVLKEQKQ